MVNDTCLPVVVLASGRGSNLSALLEAQSNTKPGYRINALICNRPKAKALKIAGRHKVPVHLIDHTEYDRRAAFERKLDQRLAQFSGHLIVLAGFMRILGDQLVERYQGRMINLHPSLLPKYPGLNTHAQVLASGDVHHGASVHFVVPELDAGPVISQVRMTINGSSSAADLAQRLSPLEHRLLVKTVELFARETIELRDQQIYINNETLNEPFDFS